MNYNGVVFEIGSVRIVMVSENRKDCDEILQHLKTRFEITGENATVPDGENLSDAIVDAAMYPIAAQTRTWKVYFENNETAIIESDGNSEEVMKMATKMFGRTIIKATIIS